MRTKNANKKCKNEKQTKKFTTVRVRNMGKARTWFCSVACADSKIKKFITDEPSLGPNSPPRAHNIQLLCPAPIHWDAATWSAVDLMGTTPLVG